MKPWLCDIHDVLLSDAGNPCPDCMSEGVAVLTPAPLREPWARELDRMALLWQLAIVRARTSRTASRIRKIGRGSR